MHDGMACCSIFISATAAAAGALGQEQHTPCVVGVASLVQVCEPKRETQLLSLLLLPQEGGFRTAAPGTSHVLGFCFV